MISLMNNICCKTYKASNLNIKSLISIFNKYNTSITEHTEYLEILIGYVIGHCEPNEITEASYK